MDTQSQTTELSLQISALSCQAGGTGRDYHSSPPFTQGEAEEQDSRLASPGQTTCHWQ